MDHREPTVLDDLTRVLRHQCDAAHDLEGRLRRLELLVQAGEERFLSLAVDEVHDASERLAALELTRSLSLVAATGADQVAASEVAAGAPVEVAERFTTRVAELRARVERIEELRGRLTSVLHEVREEGQHRLATAGVA